MSIIVREECTEISFEITCYLNGCVFFIVAEQLIVITIGKKFVRRNMQEIYAIVSVTNIKLDI